MHSLPDVPEIDLCVPGENGPGDGKAGVHHFVIRGEEAGQRVDECLARRLPLLSRTKLRALVGTGAATLGGKRLSIGERLRGGDVLCFRWQAWRVPPGFPEAIPVTVLWEDEYLLAVDKPAGMLVHPTRGVKRGTLANALLAYLNPGLGDDVVTPEGDSAVCWPRFVHRLDKETSGVILVAKSQTVASAMGKSLAAGGMEKRYLAILGGAAANSWSAGDLLTIEQPIARFEDQPPFWRCDLAGKYALTLCRALATVEDLAFCALKPVTGRTNQLRIHAAWLGAPILGDAGYGGEPASRLMLHAESIGFSHPITGERHTPRARLPQAMRDAFPVEPAVWESAIRDQLAGLRAPLLDSDMQG